VPDADFRRAAVPPWWYRARRTPGGNPDEARGPAGDRAGRRSVVSRSDAGAEPTSTTCRAVAAGDVSPGGDVIPTMVAAAAADLAEICAERVATGARLLTFFGADERTR